MDAVRNLSVKQLKAALVAKGVTFPIKASKASLLEFYQQECVRVTQPSAAIVPERTRHDTRLAKNKRGGSVSNAPQLPVKKGRPASKTKLAVLNSSRAINAGQPPEVLDFSLGSDRFGPVLASLQDSVAMLTQTVSKLAVSDSNTNSK